MSTNSLRAHRAKAARADKVVESLESRRLLAASPVVLLAGINPGNASSTLSPSESPNDAFVEVNGRLVFAADEGNREQSIWGTDGTPEGTSRLLDLSPPGIRARVADVKPLDGLACFFVEVNLGQNDQRVYRSDGTPEGTVEVKRVSFAQSFEGPIEVPVVESGGALYFWGGVGENAVRARGLSKTNGTADGTVLVKQFDDVPVTNFTSVGNELYFVAETDLFGGLNELWKSDGTEAGTVLIKRFADATGRGTAANYLSDVNGTLFFRANAPGGKSALWKSDGTEAGTVMVSQPFPFLPKDTDADLRIMDVGGQAMFVGAGRETGGELWKSDGTEAGTGPVKDIDPGNSSSNPTWLREAKGELYFGADDLTHGRELWKSDGTPEGTVMVTDLIPGSGSARPIAWGTVGGSDGLVYFSGANQLWSTDGTAAGTELAAAGGTEVAFPTAIGEHLVFRARDNAYGSEPRAVTLSPRPARVVGRHVFYNNSYFDGHDAAANAADDGAIAAGKGALQPGAAASFANVTSYTRGLNGIMVDVTGLRDAAALRAGDFTFESASGPNGEWRSAPAPQSVVVRPGAGDDGSDRVTLTWRDGVIRNAWLRVTVKADPVTGLAESDVFCFGNLVGKVSASSTFTPRVTGLDVLAVRRALNRRASIRQLEDVNRDGRVSALDLAAVLGNRSSTLAPTPATEPVRSSVATSAAGVRASDLLHGTG